MDIQKEREAFEALYKPCDRIAFCFGLKKYVQLSNEDNDSEIVDHANQCWELWQAAKAQAIPEGFALVPREMPESFDNGLYAYSNNISIVDSNSDGFIPMSDINHAEVWKLVVEAQEQGHE